MVHRVFVFGTLKEGFPNFATNKGARLPGTFATKERYPLYLVGERHSPWLIDQAGEGEHVLGQVFEVDAATLEAMDRLERVDQADGYRRVQITVEAALGDGAPPIEAFAYLKQAAHVDMCEVRLGPLHEYKPEHAALYRPRK